MTEKTKEDLVADAQAAGVGNPERLTKPELKERIDAAAPAELGPVIPPGSDAPAFESHGSITGVQPLTADEIPESGR